MYTSEVYILADLLLFYKNCYSLFIYSTLILFSFDLNFGTDLKLHFLPSKANYIFIYFLCSSSYQNAEFKSTDKILSFFNRINFDWMKIRCYSLEDPDHTEKLKKVFKIQIWIEELKNNSFHFLNILFHQLHICLIFL